MVFLRFEELRFLWRCRILSSHLEGHLAACLSFQSRVQSARVVSRYVMAKKIEPKRVVVGARVQLKNDLTTDGKVQSSARRSGRPGGTRARSRGLWLHRAPSPFASGRSTSPRLTPAKPGAATAARRRARRNRLLRSTIPSASGSSRSTRRPSRGRQSRYVDSSACSHFSLLGLR